MSKRYFRMADVAARYSTSKRTVPRMVADGRIPPPTMYLGKLPMWGEAELDQNDREAAMRPRPKAEAAA